QNREPPAVPVSLPCITPYFTALHYKRRVNRTYTFTKLTPNLVQILRRQERLPAPLPHTPIIGLFVVQRENRIDVLPFAMARRDSCSALFFWNRDHMVDYA